MKGVKTIRKCKNGHEYAKSSDCPVCPVCEKERTPQSGFLVMISAPARRALEREGISTLNDLSKYSEKELLQLHGMGPSAVVKLKMELRKQKLSFRNSI